MLSGIPLSGSGSYKIMMARKEAEEGLFSLDSTVPAAFAEATEMLAGYISRTPKRMIPGRLKALAGEHKGLYQLRLAGRNRLIYRVDDDEMVVYVVYVGRHPKWDARRPGKGLI